MMGKLKVRFLKVLDIEQEELALTQSFFFLAMLMGMNYSFSAAVGESLFLNHFEPDLVKKLFPFIYLGLGISTVLIASSYSFLIKRVSIDTLVFSLPIFFCLFVIALRLLLFLGKNWTYFFISIFLPSFCIFSITLYYTFAGCYFSVYKGKKVYPYLVLGKALGSALGGALIVLLVEYFDLEDFLYVTSSFFFLIAFFFATLSFSKKIGKHRIEEEVEEESAFSSFPVREFFQNSFARLIIFASLFAFISFQLIEYQMMVTLSATLSEEKISEFLGHFYSFNGLAQIALLLLYLIPFIRSLPFTLHLSLLPITMLLLSSLFLYYQTLFYAAMANFFFLLMLETNYESFEKIIYLPLKERLRMSLQKFVNGEFYAAAVCLTSLSVLFLAYYGLPLWGFTVIVLTIALVWVAVIWRMKKAYSALLADSIQHLKIKDVKYDKISSEENAKNLLNDMLHSKNNDAILEFLLQFIQSENHRLIEEYLPALLKSDDQRIVITALQLIGESRRDSYRYKKILDDLLKDRRVAVKKEAISIKCQLEGEGSIEAILPFLKERDPAIKEVALVSIASYCGRQGHEFAIDFLIDRLHKYIGDLLHVLGRVGGDQESKMIAFYLKSSSISLQKNALKAAKEAKNPLLIPYLMEKLFDHNLLSLSLQALLNMPPESAKTFYHIAANAQKEELERLIAIKALGAIDTVAASAYLLNIIAENSALSIQLYAVITLRGMHSRSEIIVKNNIKYTFLKNKLTSNMRVLIKIFKKIAGVEELIHELFELVIFNYLQIYLSLISLEHGLETVIDIECYLKSHNEKLKANALELLNSFLSQDNLLAFKEIEFIFSKALKKSKQVKPLEYEEINFLVDAGELSAMVGAYCISKGLSEIKDITELQMESELSSYIKYISYISELKKMELFKEVSSASFAKIASVIKVEEHSKDTILFQKGERSSCFYLVVSGKIAIVSEGEVISLLGAGECIGEIGLIEGTPRTASAIVEEACKLFVISEVDYHYLITIDPEFCRALLVILSRRLRSVLQRQF